MNAFTIIVIVLLTLILVTMVWWQDIVGTGRRAGTGTDRDYGFPGENGEPESDGEHKEPEGEHKEPEHDVSSISKNSSRSRDGSPIPDIVSTSSSNWATRGAEDNVSTSSNNWATRGAEDDGNDSSDWAARDAEDDGNASSDWDEYVPDATNRNTLINTRTQATYTIRRDSPPLEWDDDSPPMGGDYEVVG